MEIIRSDNSTPFGESGEVILHTAPPSDLNLMSVLAFGEGNMMIKRKKTAYTGTKPISLTKTVTFKAFHDNCHSFLGSQVNCEAIKCLV